MKINLMIGDELVNPRTGGYITVSDIGFLSEWIFATKVKDDSLVPWSFETTPKLGFAVRKKNKEHTIGLVTYKNISGAGDGADIKSYELLLDHYEWSTDEINWFPCGTETEV